MAKSEHLVRNHVQLQNVSYMSASPPSALLSAPGPDRGGEPAIRLVCVFSQYFGYFLKPSCSSMCAHECIHVLDKREI